jgi:hypothetical protein
MPRYTLMLHDDENNEDLYLHWSSVVDAPITCAMPLAMYREWYKHEFGTQRLKEWNSGSGNRMTEEEAVDWNRAGEDDEHIQTKSELLSIYKLPNKLR